MPVSMMTVPDMAKSVRGNQSLINHSLFLYLIKITSNICDDAKNVVKI